MQILQTLCLLTLAGLVGSRLIRALHMPDVTGYLLLGLLIGPSLLGLLSSADVAALSPVSDVALAFIAFTVGGEFKLAYFRRVGAAPVVIAVFESLIASVVVALALLVIGTPLPVCLLLGAIAAATAPAATIMVINQYHAKGPVTEMLLSVVALDDATTLIIYGFASTVAIGLESTVATSMAASILAPLVEVTVAIVVGLVMGLAFAFLQRFFRDDGSRLCLVVGFVLAAAVVASTLNVSSLLLCMSLGAGLTNLYSGSGTYFTLAERFTPPVFLLFFVVSGAGLNLSVIPKIGLIGIVYLLSRVAGKVLGTWGSAKAMKADKEVALYLGPCLIPQAGVAIGLSYLAQEAMPQYADIISAVVLCATLVYELVGPSITKVCLQKSGEIEKGL